MKIPGFTAEASLYMTEDRYHMVRIISQAEESIQPALLRGRGCMEKCITQCNPNDPYCEDNCRCICYGHPGRTCWPM